MPKPKRRWYECRLTFAKIVAVLLIASYVGLLKLSASEAAYAAFYNIGSIVLSFLVGVAAQRTMRRSFWGWTILSLLFTPWAGFVFLEVAGPLPVAEDRLAEEQRRMAEEEQHAECGCPFCANSINPLTGKGLRVVEDEPWRLVCANCDREIDADQLDC